MSSSSDVELRIALHPFFQKDRLLFETKPLKRLLALVTRLILVSSESVWLQAPSGSGKSPALRFIVSQLRRLLDETTVLYFHAGRVEESNQKTFAYRFAQTVGVEQPSATAGKLRGQTDMRLILCAQASPYRKFIAGIDEAQMLRRVDFEYLKDGANALEGKGCSLVTIMMGESPRFGRKIQELLEDEQCKGLAKRFAKRRLKLPYYDSLDDIHSLCSEIDSRSIPELDRQSVTQNVLPNAWASGFRLANYAASLWDALHNAPAPAGLVFGTVRSAVLLMMADDRTAFTPKPSLFTKAARQAGGLK